MPAKADISSASPSLNFTVQIDNLGSYTVWARGKVLAGDDSLHVSVNPTFRTPYTRVLNK
ncbi:hypothetical protein MNBD_CHLOROFLEXI01-1333 [hydrothermal vent metagenome]|uniref:Uncharacterized protein n=1 Tax=hydrothermal vent metagenome TaxID=652676 RepID=A0A3B0VP86_9ZZZZ